MDEKTLSLPELAEMIPDLGYHALYQRVRRGYIKATRDVDGQYRIPYTEIAAIVRRDKYSRVPKND